MDKGINKNLSKPDLYWYMVKGLQKTTVQEAITCIRAGYSPKYADREGHKLVENSRVSEAIANAMAETTREN